MTREELMYAIQGLLPDLERAGEIFTKQDRLRRDAANKRQMYAKPWYGFLIPFMVLLGAWAILAIPGGLLMLFQGKLKIAFFFLGLTAAGAGVLYVVRKLYVKMMWMPEKQKAEESARRDLEQAALLDEDIRTLVVHMGPNLGLLPEDYRYSMAAEYFYDCLRNDRAENIRQAVELYEEHCHRVRMENYQRAILEQQMAQAEQLKEISLKADIAIAEARYAAASAYYAANKN